MKLDRATDVVSKFRGYLADIYGSYAHVYKLSHKKIMARERELIYDDPLYAKLPRWATGYLRGYRDALSNQLYKDALEWRMWYNGKACTKSEIPDGEWSKVEKDKGAHYWKGTDSVFAGYDPKAEE